MLSDKIAIIKTGGKQYKVKPGKLIKIEKLKDQEKDQEIEFSTLLIADEKNKDVKIGKPFLTEKIKGKIESLNKDKKISVIKFKNKTRYLRNKGHRQAYHYVRISDF